MAGTYGTLTPNSRPQTGNGLLDPSDQERAALLTKSQKTYSHRLHNHLTSNIDKTWGDLVLLACYVITGLLDSSSTQVWGSFVSMQTGNTVYIGLGLAAPRQSTRWIRSLISVSCFCAGSAFFSFYHRNLGARKRWVMVSSYTIQTLLMIAASIMVTVGPKSQAGSDEPVTVWTGLPLALIAFQSAGQAVTSRVLQYGGLTSVVLTSIYCDLFGDQKLFTSGLRENPERNRRAAAPVLLLVGAVVGGVWSHTSYGLTGAVWTAVALKVGVTLAWLFWRAEPGSH